MPEATVQDIEFPVVEFWSDDAGNECFSGHYRIDQFQSCRQGELRRGSRNGRTIVANDGETFVVRSVRSVAVLAPLWIQILAVPFRQQDDIEHRVSVDLERVGPMPFAEVQRRVWDSIEKNSDDWDDIDNPDPEDRARRTTEALSAAREGVWKAATLKELLEALDRAWPY